MIHEARRSRRAPARVARLACAATVAVLWSACIFRLAGPGEFPVPPDPGQLPRVPSGTPLSVLVLGDWGTGGDGQRALAQRIALTHGRNPPSFVITVGDNFYPDGVVSHLDPLWQEAFESVYAGPFWVPLVFHPSLGNHDHRGYPSAQVAYSSINPRWDMPDSYYSFEAAIPGGGSVLFVALDTNPIHREREGAEEQLAWLESTLAASRHEWVVPYGHHPFESDGPHGRSRRMIEHVQPRIEERARMYVAGHDHITELVPMANGMLQAICGGGAAEDNAYVMGDAPLAVQAFTGGGWCYLKFWREVAAVEIYDANGSLQHRELVRRGPLAN